MSKECPPEILLKIEEEANEHRKECERKYAIKLVERIVFSGVGLILIGFLSFLITLAFKKI